MASTADIVRIQYHRPPDRLDVFVQELVVQTDDCVVTLMRSTPLDRPIEVDGAVILENGSPVVWFTFFGAWHDIGLFHTSDGCFTGTYANILTPVHFVDRLTWRTTDLFLDLWLNTRLDARILDRDELEAAVSLGSIDAALAERADAEAQRLVALAATGAWPPSIVREWPLQRALERVGAA